MKLISTFLYASLFLVMFSAQACDQKDESNQEAGAQTQPTAPTPAVVPSPPAYASDKEGWLVDLDEAYAQSIQSGKPILANFTGSDWCGWCKKLDADVFSTPKFKEWADKNVVLLEVDFPRRKQLPEKNRQQNMAMAQSLGIKGYPTIWILNVTREEENSRFKVDPIGKTGYTKTPEEFIGVVANFVVAGRQNG